MSWPHSLSFSRILATPIVAGLILSNHADDLLVAALVFALASLTDLLDGPLARRRQSVGLLGIYLDTTADKVLVSIVMVAMALAHLIDGWVAMVIIGREFLISGTRTLAAAQNIVITANYAGKLKTAVTMVGIVLVLLVGNVVRKGILAIIGHVTVLHAIAWWSMTLAVVLTTVSGVIYLLDARFLLTAQRSALGASLSHDKAKQWRRSAGVDGAS
jgi:CDP-diacylglycerol--glycerol-3-phosphate 3-phosphatidyltransferase